MSYEIVHSTSQYNYYYPNVPQINTAANVNAGAAAGLMITIQPVTQNFMNALQQQQYLNQRMATGYPVSYPHIPIQYPPNANQMPGSSGHPIIWCHPNNQNVYNLLINLNQQRCAPVNQASNSSVASVEQPNQWAFCPAYSKVVVYNLPDHIQESDLYQFFRVFGRVVNAQLFVNQRTGQSRGIGEFFPNYLLRTPLGMFTDFLTFFLIGLITFDRPVNAQRAQKKMDGYVMYGRRLTVEIHRT